jgi:heme-degrading monooxygenase HmoA
MTPRPHSRSPTRWSPEAGELMSCDDCTVVAISRFSVPRAAGDSIEARFIERPRLVDRHDGFLGCEVLKTGSDPVTFVLITRWASRAKLKAYLRSDDFKSVHAGSDEAGADFKVYDLVSR